jgi:putative ABC transport system permease protein
MNWSGIKENSALAIETLAAHKFRAGLTILGVFIGVLVVVAVAAVLNGFRQTIIDNTESFGTRNVYLWRFPFLQAGKQPASVLNRKPLTLDDAKAIEQEVSAAQYVSPRLLYGVPRPGEIPPELPEVKYQDKSMSRPRFMGDFPVVESTINRQVDRGRFFTDSENEHRAFVTVIGFNVIEALFPAEDPIGKSISIMGHDFRVIGSMPKDRTGPFGSENPEDNDVIIPYWTFRKMMPNFDDHFIIVQMREGRMKEGMSQVEQVLRRRRQVGLLEDNDFDMGTADMFISTFDSILSVVFIATIGVSSIAFMVGGVGVMNVMLVAVTERTREIGIRKAVGAKRSDIIWQFLTEAVALTGAGGLAGLLVGWLMSLAMSALLPSLTMKIPIPAAVAGFFLSVMVGVLFGMWPAVKAARLDPITALRYE